MDPKVGQRVVIRLEKDSDIRPFFDGKTGTVIRLHYSHFANPAYYNTGFLGSDDECIVEIALDEPPESWREAFMVAAFMYSRNVFPIESLGEVLAKALPEGSE